MTSGSINKGVGIGEWMLGRQLTVSEPWWVKGKIGGFKNVFIINRERYREHKVYYCITRTTSGEFHYPYVFLRARENVFRIAQNI